jgi:hypothetical protein
MTEDTTIDTRMCHVQESAGSISLHSHILRFCQPRQWSKSARFSNLRLVLFVCSEICYAADGVALYFDVGRVHLPYQRNEAAQVYYLDLVLGCLSVSTGDKCDD